MRNDHFLVFLGRPGPFSQVFGQVKESLILELHEMVRMSHAFVCAMDFNLLWE